MQESDSRRMRRHGRGFLVAALLVLALVAGTPAPVLAHADLIEASPAPNSVLSASPEGITARFGEPVAPAFSAIEVLDAAGERVDAGNSRVHPDDHTRMSVPLPPLPEGTYTVTWRNVSTVDGHALRGWYVFSIGQPLDGPAAAASEQPTFTSPLEPVVRWIALVGALALVGGVAFDRAVARPALDRLRADGAVRRLREAHLRWLARLLIGGLALWAGGTLLQLPVQLTVATGEPLHRASIDALGSLLGGTDWGRAWLLRITLLAASAGLLWRWRRGAGDTTALLLVAVGALFGMSLASHGATLVALRPVGLTTDFLHLLAASTWVGGLFVLFTLVREGRAHLSGDDARAFFARLLPRFSVIAVVSVVTLAVTGMVLAWLHVNEPAALATPYGWTLVAKSLLFLTMLALGAVNLLWTTREAKRSERGGRWLGRLVGAEAGVAVALILAVGVMTSMEPARTAASGSAAIESVETAGDATVRLRLEPGEVGPNRVVLDFEDRRGEPLVPHHVSVAVDYRDAELGGRVQNATRVEPGRYELVGVTLGVAGDWEIDVLAPRTDGFDIRTRFVVPLGSGGGEASAPLPVETARWIWIAQWVALGALFHSVAWRVRRSRAGLFCHVTAGACFLAVVLVAMNVTPFQLDDGRPDTGTPVASAEALTGAGK